ncbi:MAG: hypothetical protein LBT78_07230, partial [Tannerella sp.]|nr:hypothetical protein [Tannerella sp.]
MLYIANPIYDIVFKYMMEDNKVARKFISTIIREQVLELEFAPQENTIEKNKQADPETDTRTTVQTYYRADFVAKLAVPDGYKTVLIEMQKVSQPTDIMRFRRYLGGQYRKADNISMDINGDEQARQIYCIFFFGEGLGIKGVPVLTVDNMVRDFATGESLNVKHNFIDGLHHKSWIIQVPDIKSERRRNEVEVLLSVFDQHNKTGDKHILTIREEDFPGEFHPIIRRLQKAVASEEVLRSMDFEDYFLEDIRQSVRKKAREKDRIIAKKDLALSEQAKALNEKEA